MRLPLTGLVFGLYLGSTVGTAQDLTPRAYVITPIHSNAVVLTGSFFTGSILFNPTLPISDVTANPKVQIFSFYHSLNLLGRSANIAAALPDRQGMGGVVQARIQGRQALVAHEHQETLLGEVGRRVRIET